MALKKNDLLTATIEGYTSQGVGVARAGGQVIFVQGALEGETCEIKLLKVGRNTAWARVQTLITPSPERTVPSCPHFPKCGGCDLMHMSYTEELGFKQRRVTDALERIGGICLQTEPIIAARQTAHYRNKAIYAVGCGPVTGFYRPRSHDIIPVDSCQIQAEASSRAAAGLREWMKAYGVSAYDEKNCQGLVRHLFFRQSSQRGQIGLCLVTTGRKLPHQQELVQTLLRRVPETVSVMLCVNKNRGNTVLQGEFITLWGAEQLTDTICDLEFRLSPRSFFQINHSQAQRLYQKALEYAALTGKETVLDLYCGTGTITLSMARRARTAIGAEIVQEAVQDARENARINNLDNARFIAADASQAAEQLREQGITPDVVVVDPPRKGLAPDVIDTICKMNPQRVVYVSCDPATLARDLKLFKERGYITRKAAPVDMFPRCSHVECVVLLTRTGAEKA